MSISVTLPEHFIEESPTIVKNRKDFEMSGVYVFYDEKDTPLYVGKTVNFKRRFAQHARDSKFYHFSAKARLYVVEGEFEKDVYESYLISELKPEFNLAKSFYSRLEYEDMIHEIDERIYGAREEIAELEREASSEDDDGMLGVILCAQEQITELRREIRSLQQRKSRIMSRLAG